MIQVFILTLISVLSTGWGATLDKKIDSAVKTTYSVEGYTLEVIEESFSVNEDVKKDWHQNLFSVLSGHEVVGYLYVDQAPSMKNKFDYCLMFDKEWTLINAKVLIYREQHGRQIGSKRWLSQFFNMGLEDRPELGIEIDGISGATISCKNFTNSVHQVLVNLDRIKVHAGVH